MKQNFNWDDLIDPEIPETLKDKISFDKGIFVEKAREVAKIFGIEDPTPEQIQGLWNFYAPMEVQSFGKLYEEHSQAVESVRQEAEQKIQETEQEALERGKEVGILRSRRMSPTDADKRLREIYADPNHPYNKQMPTEEERNLSMAEVNALIEIKNGFSNDYDASYQKYLPPMNPKKDTGSGDVSGRKSSNLIQRGDYDEEQVNNDIPVQDGKERSSASGRTLSDNESE